AGHYRLREMICCRRDGRGLLPFLRIPEPNHQASVHIVVEDIVGNLDDCATALASELGEGTIEELTLEIRVDDGVDARPAPEALLMCASGAYYSLFVGFTHVCFPIVPPNDPHHRAARGELKE